MPALNWDAFAKLPGSAEKNFELLCRGIARQTFGSYGVLRALANQPGVEFHLKLEREAGDVVALINGPDRYVRDDREEPPPLPPPRLWVSFAGHYRTYNPWGADFRVYLRGDRLFLSWPDGERELEVLDEGEFRVGEPWAPDRLRFETIVDGRPQQAVYNGHPYWRSFAE